MWMSLDWSHIRVHADVKGRSQSSSPYMDIFKGIHDMSFSPFFPGDRHMGHTHLSSHAPPWVDLSFTSYSPVSGH